MEKGKQNRILRVGLILGLGGLLPFCNRSRPNSEDGVTSSGGSTGVGGRYQKADDLSGGDDSDDFDLTKVPVTTPCDYFPTVEPPCDETLDIVSVCHLFGVLVSFSPRVSVDPSSIVRLIMLPRNGARPGEGGQGGSAGAPGEDEYLLVLSSATEVRIHGDGTFSLLGSSATLSFWIDPVSASELLEPLGGSYEPQLGTVALMEGDRILEQRRVFFFAEMNCYD